MWYSPEIFVGHPADKYSDLYSIGIVFWELLTERLPYSEDRNEINNQHFNLAEFAKKMRTEPNYRPSLVFSPTVQNNEKRDLYISIIKDCWQQEKNLRPSNIQLIISKLEKCVLN